MLTALAEPVGAEPARGFFRLAPGATVASFHQTQVYDGFQIGPTDIVHDVDRVEATQLGGQIEMAAGVQLGTRVQLGGVLRYTLVPNVNDATNYPRSKLGYTVLSPQLTVFATSRLYARAELGFADLSHHGYGDSGLAMGAELGSGAIVQGRFMQLGIAVSHATTSSTDDGDHGMWTTDSRITTVSAVLSMNVGNHP